VDASTQTKKEVVSFSFFFFGEITLSLEHSINFSEIEVSLVVVFINSFELMEKSLRYCPLLLLSQIVLRIFGSEFYAIVKHEKFKASSGDYLAESRES